MSGSIIGRAVLGLALGSVAVAGHAKGISYDCDSAPGHFSELNLPVESVPFIVTGKVQVNTLAEHKTYIPSTKLTIAPSTPAGQLPESYAGLTLVALAMDAKTPGAKPLPVQMSGFTANGRDDDMLPHSVTDKLGVAQPFRLSYDGRQVAVTIGDDTKSFPLKTDAPMVQVMCSTGEFLYTDLQILSGR
ncbi:hypothetical protein [Sphingomonas sanguinis]|uniref:Uncharacterized protein n=1 Tax=Sphingomonas sanguinis TaxID=33051 RepID=A0A147J898_9SPHN|nr:hypothetical protein [Sphingomonas sanguinis]KTW12524.1 hypothetical protein NS258_10110 [Sphingomonas sanguinis]